MSTTKHLKLEWHSIKDLLAVSSINSNSGGFISFFTKKGGKPFFSSKVRNQNSPTTFCWHPTESLLAIGWETGHLSLVDPTKRTANTKDRKPATSSAGKDSSRRQNSAPKSSEETLTELINRHKRITELQSFGDDNNVKNGRKGRRRFAMTEPDTTPVFIFGMEQGGVYLFDPANKQLNKIFQADSGIRQILDMPQQNYFLAITDEMMFYQLMCVDKLVNDKIKVKLAAKSKYFQMIRVGFGTVAFAYGDREIRVWDLEAEDSAILRLRSDRGYEASDEQVLILSYLPKKDSICGLTSKWRLATWRRVQNSNFEENNTNIARSLIDQQWRLASAISLNIQQVIGMAWSNNSAAFALNSGDSVQIFLSQCIEYFVDTNYAVIQVSAQLLNLVKITDPVETQELQLHSNIRGFFIQLDQIHCPKDAPIKIENVASFDVNNISQAAYSNQHIYTLANEQLLVRTLQGTIKRSITFREIEGKPEMLNVKGSWLCVASSLGYIRIYDLSESSMKLTFRSSNLRNSIPTFNNWQHVRINSAGNRVSFTLRKDDDEQISSERIYVWEAENDSVGYFSFNSGITDQQQYEQDSVATMPSTARPKTAAIRQLKKNF
uniref:WD_REPEATS_REGION domain-containing protein n=1 Tax=Meloidogyne hapla TaxID=6305 RepID=A0A1I8C224_MELHA